MRKLLERIEGAVSVELAGAFPEAVLNACATRGIRLRSVRRPDACTLLCTVRERELPALREAARASGCELRILAQSGGSRNLRFLRRRVWLLVAAMVVAAALLISSLFLWEIEIRGAETLSEGEVLRVLAECGVEEGSFWPGISADLVRSRMLSELPELAWMTVNVSGSRAVVLVSERRERPEIYAEGKPCDLVAARDGIVSSLSVLEGLPLVAPGQAVAAGETLVSGRMESLSHPVRLVRAQGSVTAETHYERTAICPLEMNEKTGKTHSRSRFALQLGKKRINFYFGQGKELDECEKIVHKYNLGLKGLFALPITLIREERIFAARSVQTVDREREMQEALLMTLAGEIDGEILEMRFAREEKNGLLYVTLYARCSENIARSRTIGEE